MIFSLYSKRFKHCSIFLINSKGTGIDRFFDRNYEDYEHIGTVQPVAMNEKQFITEHLFTEFKAVQPFPKSRKCRCPHQVFPMSHW